MENKEGAVKGLRTGKRLRTGKWWRTRKGSRINLNIQNMVSCILIPHFLESGDSDRKP